MRDVSRHFVPHMMIAYTSDEAKYLKMPKEWRKLDNLEELTGADFLISPLNLPAHSESMLAKHIKAGSYLVQVKRGWDFTNSLAGSGNLWDMILRMDEFAQRNKITIRPAQKIVLFCGIIYALPNGELRLNNQKPKQKVNYAQVIGAIERIFERGATYTSVSAKGAMYHWLTIKEQHAKDNYSGEKKPVWDARKPMYDVSEKMNHVLTNEPLQSMFRVDDFRNVLRSFMGEKQATALWEYAGRNGMLALCFAFDPQFYLDENRPKGLFGKEFAIRNRALAQADGDVYLRLALLGDRPPKGKITK